VKRAFGARMNWRQFLKINKAMLLTLPGAALWSLPVGIAAWRAFVPAMTLTDPMFKSAIYAGYGLTPIAAVCSFMAMELYSESRSNYGVSVLLLLFNQVTTVVASVGTLAEVIELAVRVIR
jgi:hypothetical protein